MLFWFKLWFGYSFFVFYIFIYFSLLWLSLFPFLPFSYLYDVTVGWDVIQPNVYVEMI